MQNNKVFILLPDGVGLRNFAYSGFYEAGKQEGLNFVFWNNTPFDLKGLGLPEIKIGNSKTHPVTEIYKKAKVQVELNLNIKKSNDPIYNSYRFPFPYTSLKNTIKISAIRFLAATHSSNSGLLKIRNRLKKEERKTLYYHQSVETLQKEKPAMVFCTNQRHVVTIAPLLAAQDLGIPTAAFIYSWDNLPKATLVVETDCYFVWSDFMKKELLYYYPYIKEEQIIITGTPQFEMHFKADKRLSREAFFSQNGLDINKKYLCFSGDDSTTSPDDPAYLEDVAKAVQELNKRDLNLGILFRRCPVDFSDRYDAVLEKYADIIVPVNPLWKPLASEWNAILPTKEDDDLFSNIAEHCEMVLNLGSSTVFDFAAHNKPCGYFRYNQKEQLDPKWSIFKCYKFIHFRSMPSSDAVFWLDSAEEMPQKIASMLTEKSNIVLDNAKKWFEKINQHPPQEASSRILKAINKIIKK
jgi:hypothetical protein